MATAVAAEMVAPVTSRVAIFCRCCVSYNSGYLGNLCYVPATLAAAATVAAEFSAAAAYVVVAAMSVSDTNIIIIVRKHTLLF
jgi:hypothetical protein